MIASWQRNKNIDPDLENKYSLITLAIALGFSALAIGIGSFIGIRMSNNAWNNGICKECGGTYIYQGEEYHKYHEITVAGAYYHVYKCDTCGNIYYSAIKR